MKKGLLKRLKTESKPVPESEKFIDLGDINIEGLELAPDVVDTNMVAFEVDPRLGTAGEFVGRLADEGLKMGAVGPTRVRAVTHLNLAADAVERAAPILRQTAEAATSGPAASAVV